MRAATLAAPGEIVVGHFPRPAPQAGDVLVRMEHASICGSDVHVVFDGFQRPEMVGRPGYPGHEGVGVVVESLDPAFAPGTPVLTVPPGAQGQCFAEFQVVPGTYLVPLPDGADLRRMLMAQQVGTTLFAMRRIGRPPGDVAVVIGAGSAGTYFVQHLRRAGYASVIVSDPNAQRLATAAALGATHPVLVPQESLEQTVHEVTGGQGADLVIEAAGYDDCRNAAIELVRWQGTVCFFGYPERAGLAPYPSFLAFRRCVTIAWINGAQAEPELLSFREAVQLIDDRTIEVDHCLERMLPLEQAADALDLARRAGGGATKVGIDIAS
ncbi:zinc-binding alcohol dehydrogenase [Aeromicrobium camelliae]|uniref:Zinc-binding alcohol dehydrogenase n=2 Tax=Aeromicrobium camelliae TaxID=1538144 RepID=A0A3N6ZF17_9ACTN|nr:zinc-binding alcohol dehydrogenase [Aeromicrobium camelliae]